MQTDGKYHNESYALLFAVCWLSGCSGSSDNGSSGGGGSAAEQTNGPSGTSSGTGTGSGTGGSGTGPTPVPGQPVQIIPAPATTLPPLPTLVNLNGSIVDDQVVINFDPVDGAADYRIYPLPADGDITVNGSAVTVHNATYRCAGDIETPPVYSDDGANPNANGSYQTASVLNNVNGYTRTLAEATLGYVYAVAGDGLVPVWSMGNPNYHADTTDQCYNAGWGASRAKKYTSSQSEHDMLVSQGWRDNGVMFYAPAANASGTRPVYTAGDDNGTYTTRFYFAEPAEKAVFMDAAATNFVVFTTQQANTQPLSRVNYSSACGASHDELVVGKARFDNTYHQGNYPTPHLTWSGVTAPTVMVVEALSTGCPYQGFLSPSHVDSMTVQVSADPPTYTQPAFQTLDELRAASPTGEVYINAQTDTSTPPVAIARTYVQVSPEAPPKMDFFDGFHTWQPLTMGAMTSGISCSGMTHLENDTYDVAGYCLGGPLTVGTIEGQLWAVLEDGAGDTNGKFRLTPKQMAKLDATTFLHATMSVDSVTTRRRYSQVMISDQPYPLQDNMPKGNTIVVQQIGIWPPNLVVQYCDHVMWDTNSQCNTFSFYRNGYGDTTPLPPTMNVGEEDGTDRSNQYDVYMSTSRVYVFFEGEPYGCAILPANHFQPGAASVTFGDVLYHSAVDAVIMPDIYNFHSRHLGYESRHHYDNIGFSSGVPEPTWDLQRLPCQTDLRDFDTEALVMTDP